MALEILFLASATLTSQNYVTQIWQQNNLIRIFNRLELFNGENEYKFASYFIRILYFGEGKTVPLKTPIPPYFSNLKILRSYKKSVRPPTWNEPHGGQFQDAGCFSWP